MKRSPAAALLVAAICGSVIACGSEPSSTPIEWRLNNEVDVRVLSIVGYERPLDDRTGVSATIRIVVEGTWTTDPSSKPQVVADGVELCVVGVGSYSTAEGPQTSVEAGLPGGVTPKTLLLRLGSASSGYVELEFTLSP